VFGHGQADWLRSMAQQQQQHMLQQQAAEAAAAAAYVNAANKRMGNGAGPMVGIAGMGMGGHMGAAMGGGLPGGMHGAGLGMGLGAMRGAMDVNMGLAPGSTPSPESDGGHNGLSLSPMHYGLDGPLRGRKRGPDGPVEKVVERRQRRMIKNRESAARSRARKQVCHHAVQEFAAHSTIGHATGIDGESFPATRNTELHRLT
jgi:hypothetical protein